MAKKPHTLTAKSERSGFSLWRRLPDGKEITILDGKTLEPVTVSRATVHEFNNGIKNEAWRLANMLMED